MLILGLEKNGLHKICVSGTVGGPVLTQKTLGSGILTSDARYFVEDLLMGP